MVRGKVRRAVRECVTDECRLKGQLVELKTADYVYRGTIQEINESFTCFHLTDAVEVTENLKIPGTIVVGGVLSKKLLKKDPMETLLNTVSSQMLTRSTDQDYSEHEEGSGQDLPLPILQDDDDSERPPRAVETVVVVPEEYKNSVLFRHLKGRKIKDDEQPAHLNRIRCYEPSTGLSEMQAVKPNSPNGEANFRSKSETISLWDKSRENSDLVSTEFFDENGVFFAVNHLDMMKVVQFLKRETLLGFALQGDLRKNPANVSLICFSTPSKVVIVDFIACGGCFGKMRDWLGQFLESKAILKVCIECGIVAQVLRTQFKLQLNNVFDPQCVDGYLAGGGEVLANLVPQQYFGLKTLMRLYCPDLCALQPEYVLKSEKDYLVWLERPLKPVLKEVAVGEVRFLPALYKVQQDRINAKCATIINCRLNQFQNKNISRFPLNLPPEMDPKMLVDPREAMERRYSIVSQSKRGANERSVWYSKNIIHDAHHIVPRPTVSFSRNASARTVYGL